MAKKKDKSGPPGVLIRNRKARHEYDILEVVECGIELLGTEVKSLRAGQAKIDDGYARVRGGEVFLVATDIAPYPQAAEAMQHGTTRDRRLLLRRRQIHDLATHVAQKGRTLIPLAVYFKRGWAKCQLGVAVGRRKYDKRQAIRRREQQRDIARVLSARRR